MTCSCDAEARAPVIFFSQRKKMHEEHHEGFMSQLFVYGCFGCCCSSVICKMNMVDILCTIGTDRAMKFHFELNCFSQCHSSLRCYHAKIAIVVFFLTLKLG
jgi:hypothetical protein